jgi:hypothetical protein
MNAARPSLSLAALRAPTDVPAMMLGLTPKTSYKQRTAPTSNAPFDPPPARTRPTTGTGLRIVISRTALSSPYAFVAVRT